MNLLLAALLQLSGTSPLGASLDLTALYSSDLTEETSGVYLAVNSLRLKPFSPAEHFETVRLGMRPFLLSAEGLEDANFELRVETWKGTPDLLEVYDEEGNLLPLPYRFPPGGLPPRVLVNGIAPGVALLRLSYRTEDGRSGSDRVIVRLGMFRDLAGRPLDRYPHFEFPMLVNRNQVLTTAIDPHRHAERLGLAYDIYVVAHRGPLQWGRDSTLVDVSDNGVETALVQGTSIRDNIVDVWIQGLDGNAGDGLGVPHDIVFDFGQDGRLDPGDLIDGLDPVDAGIAIARNVLRRGSHAVQAFEFDDQNLFHTVGFDGGSTRTMRSRGVVVYPDPLPEGKLPLVTFSHGNTGISTSYRGYRYLQDYLASYGFITASFDMFPAHVALGIRWRAWLTNKNTERLILQTQLRDHNGNPYPPMAAGILDGKVDGDRIITVGHSRGGEGVIVQYNQVAHPDIAGIRPPGGTLQGFDADSFLGIVPISQVTFLTAAEGSKTDDRNFLMFFGGADNDVCGCTSSVLPTIHYNRALGNKMMCYLYGAGHGYFNELWSCTCTGPLIVGRGTVEQITQSYLFPFVQMVTHGNRVGKEFFTHSPNVFRTPGLDFVPADQPFVTLYRDAVAAGNHVIEDYEQNADPFVSSAGQPVAFDVNNLFEGFLRDANPTGGWNSGEPDGGFWWETSGAIFDYNGPAYYYEISIDPAERDLSDDAYLSFIVCQQADHPETEAWNNVIDFAVTLVDGGGGESSISIAPYGPVEIGHPRAGGWGASFKTVRLRLSDFETDGAGIDLHDITRVRVELGSDHGSLRGRLGFDDFEILRK